MTRVLVAAMMLLAVLPLPAQMLTVDTTTHQNINGTNITGDTLFTAFSKVNQNFSLLWSMTSSNVAWFNAVSNAYMHFMATNVPGGGGGTSSLNSDISVYQTNAPEPVTGFANPSMSSDTTPWGTVTSSSQADPVNYPDWEAFSTNGLSSSVYWLSDASDLDPWIQYEFPEPMTIYAFNLGTSGASAAALSYSSDGVNYATAWSATADGGGWVNGMNMLSTPVTGQYFKFDFPASGGCYVVNSGFWSKNMNVIATPHGLELGTGTGLGINTNYAAGFTVNVCGSVNASGYYMRGLPLATALTTQMNGVLVVSDVTGTASGLNAAYTNVAGTGIYLSMNNTPGVNTNAVLLPGHYSYQGLNFGIAQPQIVSALSSLTTVPTYMGNSVMGYYYPISTSPSCSPLVAP